MVWFFFVTAFPGNSGDLPEARCGSILLVVFLNPTVPNDHNTFWDNRDVDGYRPTSTDIVLNMMEHSQDENVDPTNAAPASDPMEVEEEPAFESPNPSFDPDAQDLLDSLENLDEDEDLDALEVDLDEDLEDPQGEEKNQGVGDQPPDGSVALAGPADPAFAAHGFTSCEDRFGGFIAPTRFFPGSAEVLVIGKTD